MAMPPPAKADFMLTLHEQGYRDVTVSDNGTGFIAYGGGFGSFFIQGDFGYSNSNTGVEPATLTINQLSIQNTSGTGTLQITLTDTGFMVPHAGPAVMNSQLSTTSLTGTGSVSFQSFLNGVGGTKLTLGTAPSGTSATDAMTISSDPYTLSNITTVTLGAGGLLQSTGTTTVTTPAPGALMLALTGLPLLGVGAWRRLRKRA